MASKGMSVFTHGGEDYNINDPNTADEFSASTDYTVGQYVTYGGSLYRFTSDHSAGSWNSSHATVVRVGEEIGNVEDIACAEEFDPAKVYARGDLVTRRRVLYRRKSSTGSADGSWMSGRWDATDLKTELHAALDNRLPANTANLLFSARDLILNRAYSNQTINDLRYCYFRVSVESGVTYYSNVYMRYVSKDGTKLAENVMLYTPNFSGDMLVTYRNAPGGFILATTADMAQIRPYTLMQNNGLSPFQPVADNDNYLYSAIKFVRNAYYDPSQSGEHSSTAYSYFVIPVISGTTYYILRARFVTKSGTKIYNAVENQAYEADFTGNLFVTVRNTDPWVVSLLEDMSGVGPYNFPYWNSNTLLQTTGNDNSRPMSQQAVTNAILGVSGGSPLLNKKWTACGDSFTEGDFTGLDEADYKFQDAPYQGSNMVYPFWIGRRTGCLVTNEAKSGSTLAYISGRSNCFSESGGRYTKIAADADYITLYFGINDSHQDVPIGTIDDDVNTTFYGAWNIVMEYLITNHPNAKIGIIISNGCEATDYPEATIAIAKKWGVAYFDMNDDPRIPLVYRVNGKSDLCQTVIDLRTAQYRVSSTNGHPNVACHKDESTFIQAWLESI